MREIVLDTETTGLDPNSGDRVVEIGAVELVNGFPTGRHFHVYINPERAMDWEAQNVHGLTDAFLADKPRFAEIVGDFVTFAEGARVVAHNATFDVAFLNMELGRCGMPHIHAGLVVDTLALARRKHPAGPNTLDALCARYGIDNAHRTLHGALLDAKLLAEVYVELQGGRQASLALLGEENDAGAGMVIRVPARQRLSPLPPRAFAAERAAHLAFVAALGPSALWRRYGEPEPLAAAE